MVSTKEEVSSPTEAGLCIHQGRLVWVRKLDDRDDRGGHRNDVGICVPIRQLCGRIYGFQGIDNRLRAFLQLKGNQIPSNHQRRCHPWRTAQRSGEGVRPRMLHSLRKPRAYTTVDNQRLLPRAESNLTSDETRGEDVVAIPFLPILLGTAGLCKLLDHRFLRKDSL
jgi:hypothetical protein